jgi:hypothetical protein
MSSNGRATPDEQADEADSTDQNSDDSGDDYREVMDNNYELLKNLEHRTVIIRSNRYEEEDREYYVEEVEKAYLDGGSGYIPSVRLVNENVRPSLQPVLKMPRKAIPVEEDEEYRTLRLIYTSEPDVEHSFHYMNKYERPDLKIFITYEK